MQQKLHLMILMKQSAPFRRNADILLCLFQWKKLQSSLLVASRWRPLKTHLLSVIRSHALSVRPHPPHTPRPPANWTNQRAQRAAQRRWVNQRAASAQWPSPHLDIFWVSMTTLEDKRERTGRGQKRRRRRGRGWWVGGWVWEGSALGWVALASANRGAAQHLSSALMNQTARMTRCGWSCRSYVKGDRWIGEGMMLVEVIKTFLYL